MSIALKVDLDIKHVLDAFNGLPPSAMQAAWRRTLRKVSTWVKSQVARAVAKETRIQRKVLMTRIYFFLRSRDSGKVWLGLNPIEAHRLGAVRDLGGGAPGFAGPGGVLVTDSRKTGPRRYYQNAWTMRHRDPNGPIYSRVGKARTPYGIVKVDWEGSGEKAFREAAARVEERLLVVLRQELNYEIHKALGRGRKT
jgi:hypothetical protein